MVVLETYLDFKSNVIVDRVNWSRSSLELLVVDVAPPIRHPYVMGF